MSDTFFYGLLIGYVTYPFWQALKAIVVNAWNRTSTCTGDCNQGRNCTCKEKQNGV